MFCGGRAYIAGAAPFKYGIKGVAAEAYDGVGAIMAADVYNGVDVIAAAGATFAVLVVAAETLARGSSDGVDAVAFVDAVEVLVISVLLTCGSNGGVWRYGDGVVCGSNGGSSVVVFVIPMVPKFGALAKLRLWLLVASICWHKRLLSFNSFWVSRS